MTSSTELTSPPVNAATPLKPMPVWLILLAIWLSLHLAGGLISILGVGGFLVFFHSDMYYHEYESIWGLVVGAAVGIIGVLLLLILPAFIGLFKLFQRRPGALFWLRAALLLSFLINGGTALLTAIVLNSNTYEIISISNQTYFFFSLTKTGLALIAATQLAWFFYLGNSVEARQFLNLPPCPENFSGAPAGAGLLAWFFTVIIVLSLTKLPFYVGGIFYYLNKKEFTDNLPLSLIVTLILEIMLLIVNLAALVGLKFRAGPARAIIIGAPPLNLLTYLYYFIAPIYFLISEGEVRGVLLQMVFQLILNLFIIVIALAAFIYTLRSAQLRRHLSPPAPEMSDLEPVHSSKG